MATKVSVIMNCLNGGKYLKEAIDSVYAQTYKDWEIIFWDNASTDNSAEIAKSYDNRLRYFRSEETVPLGKARNWAIEKAGGKYIAFLDCDDIWMPEKLDKQILLFDDSQVGLVYSDAIFFSDKTKYTYQLYKASPSPSRGNIFGNMFGDCGLVLSTVILRRNAINNIAFPWFAEDMEISEEFDLFMRILYRWNADYAEEPLVKYRLHGQNWSLKRPDLMAQEIKRIIDRLNYFFPDMHERYAKEIAYFNDIRYRMWKAEGFWYSDDTKKARQELAAILKKRFNIRAIIAYLLTYFYTFEQFRSTIERLKYYKIKLLSIIR